MSLRVYDCTYMLSGLCNMTAIDNMHNTEGASLAHWPCSSPSVVVLHNRLPRLHFCFPAFSSISSFSLELPHHRSSSSSSDHHRFPPPHFPLETSCRLSRFLVYIIPWLVLDAFSHLYERVCPSVCLSARPSVRPSVHRSRSS